MNKFALQSTISPLEGKLGHASILSSTDGKELIDSDFKSSPFVKMGSGTFLNLPKIDFNFTSPRPELVKRLSLNGLPT